MQVVLAIVLALTYVSANQSLDDFINEINTKQNLWTAGKNFRDTPISELTSLLSSRKLPEDVSEPLPFIKHNINESDIPNSFDARTKWPQCESIKEVRDESACGSTWAVAVTSVISDRICIHSSGRLHPEISVRYVISCLTLAWGCFGGFANYVYAFWRDQGIVTGGPYGSNNGCQPYLFAPCEHYINGTKPPCPKENYETPKCERKCDNSTIDFNKDKYFAETTYQVKSADIEVEIMKNGPVSATLDLYADLLLYKSGVYYRTTDDVKGALVVRIIGWGVENDTKYWLAVNSWNEDWGDKGMFKIRRGVDECGIESKVYAGIPKLRLQL